MNTQIYYDEGKEGDEILVPVSATVSPPLRARGR